MAAEPEPRSTTLRRMIVGYRLSAALHVAAKLGIADILVQGPKGVSELSEATATNADALCRVMRLLASEGVFEETAPRHFKLTSLAEPLRSDVADSLRGRAIFDGERCNWHPWGNLIKSVESGASAFDQTFGMAAFDYFKDHPQAATYFDNLMAEQTRSWAPSIVEAYDFTKIGALVDVGGGYGALLIAVLSAYPNVKGVLADLPHVVSVARDKLEEADLGDRCETHGGDFFQSVPSGADAYLLKHVLHDWDDESCTRILRNCRHAMPVKGRLLVVEILLAHGNEPDYGKYLDVNMLVITKGKERTESEYGRLFEAAGFSISSVVPTVSELSIIEAKPI